MKNSLKLRVLALITAAALSGSAYAAFTFYDLDVNVDGMLTQDELSEYAGVVQHWSEIDTNSDSMIDENEFDVFVRDLDLSEKTGWQKSTSPGPRGVNPARAAAIDDEFDALDTNGDGNLSRTEFRNLSIN